MVIVTDVIKGSIEAIYIKWLEDELRLKIGEPNTVWQNFRMFIFFSLVALFCIEMCISVSEVTY